jgi:hypothetical protein
VARAARALVDNYARHSDLCGIVGGYGRCTCGLDDAIRILKGTGDDAS